MKRIIALALILAALLGVLYSCSGQDGDNINGRTADSESGGDTDAAGKDGEEEQILPNLPEADFGGESVTFLTAMPFEGATGWSANRDIFAEEDTGEPLNDAVFYRNLEIQEKYNVEINVAARGGPHDSFRNSVNSGDGAYDVIIHTLEDMSGLIFRNLFLDLKQVPNIDLPKPWWDQNANEAFTIGGGLYITTGDITTQAVDSIFVLLFNKQLISDFGLTTPYQYVRDGSWTFDRMLEMMKTEGVARDIDGDGIIGLEDQFALGTMNRFPNALFFAAGQRVTEKDESGIPQFVLNNDKTINVLNKAIEFMDKNYTLDVTPIPEGWTVGEKLFAENKILFYGSVLQLFARLREMNDSFGLLPMPKWDESQDGYNCYVIEVSGVLGMPVTLEGERLNMVSHVTEAMCAASRYTLIPAFYDMTLTSKLMRDEESAEMLDIILNSGVFDIGFTRDWGRLFSRSFRDNAISGAGGFVSSYESLIEAAESAREREIDSLFE
ncbi:MAG: extracellular solute-binding protein [Oscillospiraceae bacterium]|nr:extracellular solute-binding protein [Oscillospiraceae bacterium]